METCVRISNLNKSIFHINDNDQNDKFFASLSGRMGEYG